MRKTFILLTFLCVSVMGWAGVAQDTWIPTTAPSTEPYSEQFKWFAISGENIDGLSVNQIEDRSGEIVIYVNFSDAGFNSIIGCEALNESGALAFLKVSSLLTSEYTDVYIKNDEVTRWAFRIQNTKYSSASDTDHESATIWNNVNWIAGSNDKLKMVVSPAGPNIVNVQSHGNPSQNTIYVTYTGAPNFGDCSLGESAYETQGTGVFFYTSNFWKQETVFTQEFNGTTYTYHVYNADGEPEDLNGWNIAKGKTAHAGANDASAYRAVDGVKTGDEHRWGSSDAQHYAKVGDAAQDWWYVDLGGFYEISQIKILFETACPNDYDILTSPNGTSWVVARTLTVAPKTGTTDDQYNIYDFSPAKVARYIKVFAREGYEHLKYGFSMWEFEAYGDRAEGYDVNPPTLTSAVVSGSPTANEIKIAVSAIDTEDDEVSLFHVIEPTLGYDRNITAVEGKLTFSGLEENTAYHFTITALDAIGNQSSEIIVNASTTVDPSVPAVVAPIPPVREADDVRRVYSDSYTDVLDHDFAKHMWEGVVEQSKVKDGNNYLIYDMSAGGTVVIWGFNDDGGDAIIAKEAYRAPGQMGLDVSGMEMMHVDIWSNVALSNISVCINDPTLRNISHNGEGWQSYDIELTSPVGNVDLTNLRWMKFKGIEQIGRQKIAIDNVYFWKTSTGLKSVSATANNATYGTASVVVTETGLAPEGGTVADGTEVTFSAVANDGYLFTGWSNGESRATFNATVDAAMNLTANFRALGTTYCNTEVTSTRDDDVHVAYATMKRTSANNYKLVVRSAETLGNFSNTTLQVNGSENLNLNNQGTLTDNNHVLTYEFTSTTPPSMTSGYMYLNVPGSKFTECWFTRLTNIEYEVPCDDEDVPVESISLNYTETTIEIGNTKTLVVTFNPVYATDKTITWTTTNSSVASVEDGVVTANAIGTATITAETSNGKTATFSVTVEPVTEKTCWGVGNDFTYQGNPVSYDYAITRNTNKTLTYTAEFSRDVAGLEIQVNVHDNGVYSTMSYDSGSKTATFTTTETFNTGNSLQGFFYFGGNRTDYNYTIGEECAKPSVVVTGVTINHTSATLMIDETVTLSAEVVPANADDKEIVWENSDPSVASFESSTGLVTALAVGTTTITAKSHADESIFATCVVTVVSSMTPATWYGYSTVSPLVGLTAYTYSITRGTDHKLTFTMTTDKNVVGYVSGIEGDVTGAFSGYDAENHTGTFTTAGTYTDGTELHLQLTFASESYGAPAYNFTYTVGSENDPLPQAVAVDEEKDNSAILTTYDGQTVIGVLGRSFTAGNLYTLVLPFGVEAEQRAEKLPGQLTKLNNSYLKDNGDLRINFVDAEAIEAGVPYLYSPSANITNPVFTGVTVNKDLHPDPAELVDGYAKYYGIYAPMDGSQLHGITNGYVLGGDRYLYRTADLPADQTMKALRGYFVLDFQTSGANAPRARVIFNSQETEIATGISDVQSAPVQCTKVLRDGQLLIIRDGRTYNAQGQWIK